MHLTNGNTTALTGMVINDILSRAQHPSDHLKNEALPQVLHPLTPDRFNSTDAERENRPADIVCHALLLFRCSESILQKQKQAHHQQQQQQQQQKQTQSQSALPAASFVITQSAVVNAVVTVFSECQFSRASLLDLNDLHETAKTVVDFIFSIFMLLLVQIILKVDVSKIIAPLLTILFGLSFAFSPVLSNLFLSMAFVMFLLPFNVGNRVSAGF